MNCDQFQNVFILVILEILITNDILNMIENKVENVCLFEDLHLFEIVMFRN